MSELVSSWQNFEDEEQIVAVAAQIGCAALDIVDATYGSGMPLWTPGRQELSYHNGHHGRMVGQGAAQMAAALELPAAYVAVAEAAGNAHDINQLDGRGIDEAKSAVWLTNQMEVRKLFTPALQEAGRLAIIGTEPLFDENFRLVGQKATELTYTNREEELTAKSVACADFGELFQPQGPLLSHQLFREIQGMKPAAALPMDKLATFQAGQIALIDRYEYPLAEANTVLATHRPEVAAYGEQVLGQLERGDITSWQQLIDQDIAFMQRHQ